MFKNQKQGEKEEVAGDFKNQEISLEQVQFPVSARRWFFPPK